MLYISRLKMNKKGSDIIASNIPALVLTALIILLAGYAIYKYVVVPFFGGSVSSLYLSKEDEFCLIRGNKLLEKGNEIIDIDSDGRPDNICDICVSKNAKGDDANKDNDGDGMPNPCDKEPDDPKVAKCKFADVDGRCVEGGAQKPTST
jgi:hypothetical protein